MSTCSRCADTGWICEEHPDKPMDHEGCVGAGMPCPLCNPSDRDHPPDVSRIIRRIDYDKEGGARH
jgi:hypothetical protein